MSLTSAFDDLMRSVEVLNDPAEDKFLEFIESVSYWKSQAIDLQLEVKRLRETQVQNQKEIQTLDMKLINARHLLDVERAKMHASENEKDDLAQQIMNVMNLLGTGKVNETKEKLRELHSLSSGMSSTEIRFSDQGDAGLSTIREVYDNSSASILGVSDIDLTDDLLDQDESRLRSGNSFRKRKSDEGILDISNSKIYRCDTGKDNIALSDGNKSLADDQEVVNIVEADQILRKKQSHYPISPRPPMKDYSPRQSIYTPKTQSMYTPEQPYKTPNTNNTPPIHHRQSTSKLNTRQHAFYVKTVYKSETCQPCGKRVKFGKTALKCRDCRATCHQECKESVPRPCVPTATTPNRKGQLGVIADFTTQVNPMVPAIVVHITNEVEKRGLSEVGIYRIPGAEKEVKALKDQFLRGKGMPNISQTDVHTLCGTLKDFLRSLKESLVTHLHWKDFVRAVEDPEDSQAALYQVLTEIPQPNRDTLAWIITHLQRVAECPDCKMPASNLAKVFGPTLVGYSVSEPEAAVMFAETKLQQMVMEGLLNISNEYWSTFINTQDENLYPGTKTPEMTLSNPRKSSLTGGRRRSILMRTPLTFKDSPGSKYSRK